MDWFQHKCNDCNTEPCRVIVPAQCTMYSGPGLDYIGLNAQTHPVDVQLILRGLINKMQNIVLNNTVYFTQADW